jgi:hypothetical protein
MADINPQNNKEPLNHHQKIHEKLFSYNFKHLGFDVFSSYLLGSDCPTKTLTIMTDITVHKPDGSTYNININTFDAYKMYISTKPWVKK